MFNINLAFSLSFVSINFRNFLIRRNSYSLSCKVDLQSSDQCLEDVEIIFLVVACLARTAGEVKDASLSVSLNNANGKDVLVC